MFSFIDLTAFDPISMIIFGFLAFMSFIAVGIGLMKTLQFARLGVGKRRRAERILDTWLDGRAAEAMAMASDRRTVLTRILQAVFSGLEANPDDPSFAEELGRQTAMMELGSLTERMRLLDMVVQAAPMLGLLGTVIGMIDAFSVLAASDGAVDPTGLAGGIWTALTTTAVGLFIALIAFFIATWLEGRIDRERNLMETVISAAIHGRVAPTGN